MGAGQEGHSAASSWSSLLLRGPVTSFQPRASLTEQVEKGGEAKQLSHQSASPKLPRIAGCVLLLSGCSNKRYKQQIRHGKNFLLRLQALTFTHTVQALGAPSTHPTSTECCAGSGARVQGRGQDHRGMHRGERRGGTIISSLSHWPVGIGDGCRQCWMAKRSRDIFVSSAAGRHEVAGS